VRLSQTTKTEVENDKMFVDDQFVLHGLSLRQSGVWL